MSEPITVRAWSEWQFDRYVNHIGPRMFIPRADHGERPEVWQVVKFVSPKGREQLFHITETPELLLLCRDPVNASFKRHSDECFASRANVTKWGGYLQSSARMARDMPPDILPPGEWRDFWIAPIQKLPDPVPTPAPAPPEPAVPPVPAKRGPGRPRKESK